MTGVTRLVLVDPDPVAREALRTLLDLRPDCVVAAAVPTLGDIDEATAGGADAILVDAQLLRRGSDAAASRVLGRCRGQGMRVVALCLFLPSPEERANWPVDAWRLKDDPVGLFVAAARPDARVEPCL